MQPSLLILPTLPLSQLHTYLFCLQYRVEDEIVMNDRDPRQGRRRLYGCIGAHGVVWSTPYPHFVHTLRINIYFVYICNIYICSYK